ncbi:Kelch repeat type 1 [Trypanosoma melophagium]|uniref:Kelch repeat type 1 n=1 Tax=Trypanosoma melophagium TaxID=715481 RepID=UPI00351A7FF3|nr:Kelch repeat type 1 [Trypanosoma melophagium]
MEQHPQTDGKIELEVVGSDGRPIICRPIDVNELINQQGNSVELGDGVRVRLEEYGGETTSDSDDNSDSDDSDNDYSDNYYDEVILGENGQTDNDGGSERTNETHTLPGYRTLTTWNDVVAAARSGSTSSQQQQQQQQQRKTTSSISPTREEGWESQYRNVKTPISRRDLWASFAPPAEKGRNYSTLHTVTLIPNPTSRRFRLPPLMYHAMTSFVNPVDQGQRILVYGGTSNVGKSVGSELYEFSLLTGHWRRIEGKQFISPGNYGHTAVVVDHFHRLMVIGGVGPTGQSIPEEFLSDDEYCKTRSRILFPYEGTKKVKRLGNMSMDNLEKENLTPWSLVHRYEEEISIGFMSMLFDMDLKTNRWRAIQTAPEIPVAFHTAVVNDSNVYVFGGITNRLLVSAQLIGIHAQTYRISLIRPTGPSPQARYLHSAVVYGNWIIIYGGFDVQNEPLNDVWAFDMLNERWEELKCQGAPTRAAHAACLVGSRLIIIGGFDSSINSEQLEPSNNIFELQLVPTQSNQYIWKELHVKPVIPGLAFATACCCVDGVSFILYGGCTMAKKYTKKQQEKQEELHRTKGTIMVSRKRMIGMHGKEEHEQDDDDDDKETNAVDIDDGDSVKSLWKRLVPFGDGFAFTFPTKKKTTISSNQDGVTHVNELGVAIDPEEMSAEFKAFVRRQQDFIRKKDANLAEKMKKTTLDELENMEPHIYLKPEEIEMLLKKSDEMCESFTKYKMEMLPHNIPDRETRIKINEDCVSLSRQVRDVIKSMKGHEITVTAVKSKTHRKRTGEKLEDHSAAKPFRRVVVLNLVKEVRRHLKHVRVMNKALKTIEWAEKGEYIEVVNGMQRKLDEFIQTVKDVMEKYIEHRIESLMSSAEKRKDNMRRLKEIVEKNRHDAIFQRNTPDPQRERVKQMWQKGEIQNITSDQQTQRSQSRSSRNNTSTHHHRRRSHSIGAGYYKDENQAMILLFPKELQQLLKKASIVQKCASSFGNYCRSKISSLHEQENSQLQKTESTNDNGGNPVTISSSYPPPIVPALPSASPTPIAVVVVDGRKTTTTTTTEGGEGANAELGGASQSALVIRNSDNLRQKGAELADYVRDCTMEFVRNLENRPDGVDNTDSNTNNIGKDGKGEIILRISFLRPLIACKEKVIQLKDKIPGIRVNEWAKDNLAGAPQDEEAQKRFSLLIKALYALIQRVTMSFLTKAGARKPRMAIHTHVPQSVSVTPSAVFEKVSTSLSAKERRGVKMIHLTNSDDYYSLEESTNFIPATIKLSTQQEQQQVDQQQTPQQKPSIMFQPLSLPVYPSDTSGLPVSDVKREISKPISLTSSEAMALAPSFPTITPINREGVIVPSSNEIKVIPNNPVPTTTTTTATATTTSSSAGIHMISNPKVGVTGNSSSLISARITVSQGPNIISTALGTEIPPIQEPFSISQTRVNSEVEKSNNAGMISLDPGFFHMGATEPCVTTTSQENSNSVTFHNAADLEDDYFFFGRRSLTVKEVTPSLPTTDVPKRQVVEMMDPFPMININNVKVSPPVGTPEAISAVPAAIAEVVTRTVATCVPITQRTLLNRPSRNVRGTVVEVDAKKPMAGRLFRGKLTPGEAQILEARERLRTSSC